MKKLYYIIFFAFSNLYASEIILEKIVDDFKKPWSFSFIDQENLIITEKSGKLFTLNLTDKKISEIKHNLSILEDGQGGLLDVLYMIKKKFIFHILKIEVIGKQVHQLQKVNLIKKNIEFKNIFRAEPPINSGYHFGSRLAIKGDHLVYNCWRTRSGNDSSRRK